MRWWWAALCAGVCACSAPRTAGGEPATSDEPVVGEVLDGVGEPAPKGEDAGMGAGAPTMGDELGFEAARRGFREYAARALKRKGEALTVAPTSVKGAERQGKVGAAWALEAYEGDARARGWGLPSGEAAALDHQLGRLLEEAGLWEAKPTMSAPDLAKALVWGLRWGHRLYVNAAQGAHAPKLELDAEGRGSFVFYSSWRDPQPKGAVQPGPKEDLFKHTITLSARGQATHKEEPWRP
jgi:hypothetical protein